MVSLMTNSYYNMMKNIETDTQERPVEMRGTKSGRRRAEALGAVTSFAHIGAGGSLPSAKRRPVSARQSLLPAKQAGDGSVRAVPEEPLHSFIVTEDENERGELRQPEVTCSMPRSGGEHRT